MKWQRFEEKRKGKGRDFKCAAIPAALETRIRAGLKAGKPIAEVFAQAGQELPVITLAKAINRLADEQTDDNNSGA